MNDALIAALAAYLPRDRAAQILSGASLANEGVALIADISGFTPLTEALARELSPARGAEELTRALNSVFAPLIGEIDRHGGSVIKFGGDALIVWFPRELRGRRAALLRRALRAAARMQAAIGRHGLVRTPAGDFTLTMKIGMAYGPVLRVCLGLPEYGYEDVIGGATLDRMAEAEHHAGPGEIVLDPQDLGPTEIPQSSRGREGYLLIDRVVAAQGRYGGGAPAGRLSGAPAPDLVDTLRPYVPPEVFEALCAGRDHPAELKPVVSIFVQFQGIGYENAAEATPRLNAYFAAAQIVAARYGGRVNRLITGDKGSVLHLIFGAPRAVEELERRAALCALDLVSAAADLPFISAQRVGMAFGRAFAGPVGATGRHDYTVMGDTINLSARLMQRADPGQILVDARLAAGLGNSFMLDSIGAAHLKGKAEPVELYALRSAAVTSSSGSQAPLVAGRTPELAALRARIAELAGGKGGCALLRGELGSGKSHLLAALQAEGQVTWARAGATTYGQPRGGALIAAALRELLGLNEAEADANRLTAALGGLLGEQRAAAALPYIARFLGLPLSERQARELEALAGENLRWRIFELLREIIAAMAAHSPLALALDDLQWADPTSLDLIELLIPLVDEQPLLLLLAARSDVDGRIAALLARIETEADPALILGPLADEDAAAIVSHHAPQLGSAGIARLLERGAGNPLFLVELARTASTGSVDQLPDSIQGLLLAQIDRLPAADRATLQVAAVLGDTVSPHLLEAVAGSTQPVRLLLGDLEAAGFLLPAGESYRFRHGLIRESAYDALLYERRRVYHGAAALALERLYPAQLVERSGEIAIHHERAGNLGQALLYHGQAADAARLLYANEEAEIGYRHVLALLKQGARDEGGRRARTYLKLAQLRMNTGDYVTAQELYDTAFDLLGQDQQQSPAARRRTPLLRMGVEEPETLDPGIAAEADSLNIVANLYEGLVDLDEEMNVVPALALRWQIEDDGRRYVFELREDLRWSDGTPLTAHDLVFAWRRNLHPDTGATLARMLYDIQGAAAYHAGELIDPEQLGVQAVDARRLSVTLEAPRSYFLYALAQPVAAPLPEHSSSVSARIGNGPYSLIRWRRGRSLDLQPNPHYHSAARVRIPKVRLVFRSPGLEPYTSGEVDWCRVEDQPDLPERYAEAAFTIQYLATYLLGFSCTLPPFDRVELRQALALCVDQSRLVREVWAGLPQAATGGVVPPGIPGHSPGIGLPYDPAAAVDLYRRSGAPQLCLRLAAVSGFGDTPEFLRRCWSEHLGIETEIVGDVGIDMLLEEFQAGAFHALLLGWEMDSPDPATILSDVFHSSSPLNVFGWRDPGFDSLVEAASRIDSQPARMARYHAADQILTAQAAAVVPLYYPRSYGLLRPPFRLASGAHVLRGDRLRLKEVIM